MIDTGAMTELYLDHLRTETENYVGDGVAPAEGGWLKGQPNQSVFVPYIVAVNEGSSVFSQDFRNVTEWRVSWSMRYFGGTRKQLDWMALKGREAIQSFLKTEFGTDVYRVSGIEWRGLGSVNRVDAVNPPYWQAFDSFAFICQRKSI